MTALLVPEPAELGAVASLLVDVFAPARESADGTAAWQKWQQDPVGYCRTRLGVEPWAKQIEIMEAVRDNSSTAVKSGHKIGKSRTAGVIAWWFFESFPGARVILTSASGRQVRSILWREVRFLYNRAPIKPSPTPPLKVPDPGLECDDGREIKGFTTDDPERMAGISGENVLFIVDEASGVPAEIYAAIEGNRAGGARLLLLGNPTQTTGEFFDAFHDKRVFYKTLTVSSWETPNAVEGRAVIPGLARRDWCEQKLRMWGESSPLYQVRVLGNFPAQASNAVISLAIIEKARERDKDEELRPTGRLEIGVDVARYGDDDSVILPRRGFKIIVSEFTCVHGMDTVAIAGQAIDVARRLRQKDERASVKVDVIGVGAGVADILRRADEAERADGGPGFHVVDVNASASATATDDDGTVLFSNLRAQLHFGVADWLKDGGALPDDPDLERELLAASYSFDAQGRRKIEPKEQIKAKLNGHSPDKADALALAIFHQEDGYTGDYGHEIVGQYRMSGTRGFG